MHVCVCVCACETAEITWWLPNSSCTEARCNCALSTCLLHGKELVCGLPPDLVDAAKGACTKQLHHLVPADTEQRGSVRVEGFNALKQGGCV